MLRELSLYFLFSSAPLYLGLNLFCFQHNLISPHLTEICDNAIDDDADGLIDLNDPDCECVVIEPKSLIPNPSFEERNCCPTNRAQLSCADGWIQASEPTTDYLHTCGWMGWEGLPPPTPFPDGAGIMGFRDGRNIMGNSESNWKEYAGACLLAPLEANEEYRFQFDVGFVDRSNSPTIDITFFGTTDCDNLPFGIGNADLGCPTNGTNWVRLGSSRVSTNGSSSWVKASIDVVPTENIYAIAIGPPCAATTSTINTYYFFDNLLLDDIESFDFVISEEEHPCNENFILTLPEIANIEYQWYKDGIALIGETNSKLSKIYGEGAYQVRASKDGSCVVTQIFDYEIPTLTTSNRVILCEGESYQFGEQTINTSGDFINTFNSKNNCDSIVTLTVKALGQQSDSINIKIFEGEEYRIANYRLRTKGIHLTHLMSSKGCDSLVYVNLEYYNIYLPNIFSPNGDGQNDYFNVLGNEELVEVQNLTIYNRFGEEIYNYSDLFSNEGEGWNGMIDGTPAQPGVYPYIANVLMNDGIERKIIGDVMVIY